MGPPHTVDGRNPAPPRKSENDDSPVNTNKQMVSHGFKVVQDFVHPQYLPSAAKRAGLLLRQLGEVVHGHLQEPDHAGAWKSEVGSRKSGHLVTPSTPHPTPPPPQRNSLVFSLFLWGGGGVGWGV